MTTDRFRLVTDLSHLNRWVTPLGLDPALIDSILAMLNPSAVLSTLDMVTAYWQVSLHPHSREACAFSIPPLPKVQHTRLPMGPTPASSWMERAMRRITGSLELSCLVRYLDDCMVFGRQWDIDPNTGLIKEQHLEDHLRNLERIFCRFWNHSATLHKKKCLFFQRQIDFLGFTINKDGILPQKRLLSGIEQLRPPENVQELQSVIGVLRYQDRFVKGFAYKIEPLQERLNEELRRRPRKSKAAISLSEGELSAFHQLRQIMADFMTDPACLHHVRWERTLYCSSDASIE